MKTVYTDGSCLGNPGQGGWAAIEVDNINVVGFTLCGGDKYTTNNIMELTAVIGALERADDGPLTIVTDSKYVKDGVTKWIHNWVKNDWKKADGSSVKNKNLWIKLYRLVQERSAFPPMWQWVKAHNGDRYNEMADNLARQTAKLVN